MTSLVAQTVKHLPTMQETWVRSLGWEDPLEKEVATHSSTCGWRSVVGYSPWVCKESDTTEWLHYIPVLRNSLCLQLFCRFGDMCKEKLAAKDTIALSEISASTNYQHMVLPENEETSVQTSFAHSVVTLIQTSSSSARSTGPFRKTHHNKPDVTETFSCWNSWHFNETGWGKSKSS